MYEFIYCFAIDNKVQWSAEDAKSLLSRVTDIDRSLVEEFVECPDAGSFIVLKSGDLIVCVRKPRQGY